jgi:uncharacterized membrane protein YoaK (UPF0700 family)
MKEPRMIFGFILLVLLAVLAAVVAIGKVHQDSSYGLDYILGSLATLSGGFAQWAFGKPPEKSDKPDSNP